MKYQMACQPNGGDGDGVMGYPNKIWNKFQCENIIQCSGTL